MRIGLSVVMVTIAGGCASGRMPSGQFRALDDEGRPSRPGLTFTVARGTLSAKQRVLAGVDKAHLRLVGETATEVAAMPQGADYCVGGSMNCSVRIDVFYRERPDSVEVSVTGWETVVSDMALATDEGHLDRMKERVLSSQGPVEPNTRHWGIITDVARGIFNAR